MACYCWPPSLPSGPAPIPHEPLLPGQQQTAPGVLNVAFLNSTGADSVEVVLKASSGSPPGRVLLQCTSTVSQPLSPWQTCRVAIGPQAAGALRLQINVRTSQQGNGHLPAASPHGVPLQRSTIMDLPVLCLPAIVAEEHSIALDQRNRVVASVYNSWLLPMLQDLEAVILDAPYHVLLASCSRLVPSLMAAGLHHTLQLVRDWLEQAGHSGSTLAHLLHAGLDTVATPVNSASQSSGRTSGSTTSGHGTTGLDPAPAASTAAGAAGPSFLHVPTPLPSGLVGAAAPPPPIDQQPQAAGVPSAPAGFLLPLPSSAQQDVQGTGAAPDPSSPEFDLDMDEPSGTGATDASDEDLLLTSYVPEQVEFAQAHLLAIDPTDALSIPPTDDEGSMIESILSANLANAAGGVEQASEPAPSSPLNMLHAFGSTSTTAPPPSSDLSHVPPVNSAWLAAALLEGSASQGPVEHLLQANCSNPGSQAGQNQTSNESGVASWGAVLLSETASRPGSDAPAREGVPPRPHIRGSLSSNLSSGVTTQQSRAGAAPVMTLRSMLLGFSDPAMEDEFYRVWVDNSRWLDLSALILILLTTAALLLRSETPLTRELASSVLLLAAPLLAGSLAIVSHMQWAVRHRDLICILTRVANSVLILGHVVPGIPWSWSNPGNEQPMPYYITRMVSSVQMCIIAVVLKYIEHAVLLRHAYVPAAVEALVLASLPVLMHGTPIRLAALHAIIYFATGLACAAMAELLTRHSFCVSWGVHADTPSRTSHGSSTPVTAQSVLSSKTSSTRSGTSANSPARSERSGGAGDVVAHVVPGAPPTVRPHSLALRARTARSRQAA